MNNNFLNYKGLKLSNNVSSETDDSLAVEQSLSIAINEKPFVVLMRTPGHDHELVRGFLFTEDIYKELSIHPIIKIRTCDRFGFPLELNVLIDENKLSSGYLNSRSLLSLTSCGLCGKTEFIPTVTKDKENNKQLSISASLISSMFQQMIAKQHLFDLTGGTHAAAAFTKEGQLLSIMEDVGRHNAVDKVVGQLLLMNQLAEAYVLLLSGRASYEIVSKCFIAGIRILAVVSAPSSLAVDYAKELGITLIGFCRENRMTIYSQWATIY